jgi:ATP-binding cassette subfamily C protein
MTTKPKSTAPSQFDLAIRSLWGGFLYVAFLTLFISLAQLIVPMFMIQLYDRVMTSRSIDTLIMLLIISCTGLAIFGGLEYIRSRVYFVLGDRLARRLNTSTLQAAMTDALTHAGNPNQALRDLTDLRNFLSGSAISVPFELMFVPLFLIVLFVMHPAYGIIALVAAGILMSLSIAMEVMARRPMADAEEASSKSMAETGAALRNAEVIESMGMLPAIAQRWERGQHRVLASLDEGNRRGKGMASASKSIRSMLQLATLSTGALIIIDRAASPGTMVAASIIMGRMLLPFDHLIEGWRQWVHIRASYARLKNLLAHDEDRRAGVDLHNPQGKLVVDRVSFIPPGSDRAILRNVSFSIEPGEALGIIGPSAAGKSSLARLLVGIWKPTQGAVYLDGQNVTNWGREGFGKAVGYLPQSVSLLDGTIRENIARMQQVDPRGVIEAARRADVHEAIGGLAHGYETRVGENAFTLSGGQRQRIALARALYGNPVLLILDEPNSNLDQVGEQALLNALTVAKAEGASIVLIAHRPSIMSICDKLLVLKDGSVAQFGPRAEIMASVTADPAKPKIDRVQIAGPAPVARLVKS